MGQQNTFVMSGILIPLYLTCVDPYPGKKAKLFKGLLPDIASLTLMVDGSATYENEIPINNSISYCWLFLIFLILFTSNTPQLKLAAGMV